MAQLMWVVVLVFLITVLQLAVYRYLGGYDGASGFEAQSTDGPPPLAARDGSVAAEGVVAEDGRRCPSCGALNDPAFSFCRRCVNRIGA